MKPPVLTIEYPVAGRTVRRRLSDKWPCPLCTARLEPAGDRPVGISKRLACPSCKGEFRVVQVDMPEKVPARRWKRGPAPGKPKS
jgi:hypothetical protein